MADNEKIVRALYTILEDSLFLGDRLTKSEFGLLMQPGQFVSTQLRETDSSEDMAIQAELIDDIMDTSFLFRPQIGTVSQKYFEVLEYAALPKRNLSKAELKEVQDIRDWSQQYLPLYETYRDRYFDALDAYEAEASAQTPNGSRLRRLARKRDDALQAWETFGKRQDWDIKQGRLNYLLSGNPEVMWNEFKKRMNAHFKTAPRRGDYYQTFLVPSIAQWDSANTSWAKFEKQIDASSTYNYSKSTSWSGGVSGGWGLWSARAGGGGSTTYTREVSDVTLIVVKFEYIRVRIVRPWMVEDVFASRFWTWKKGSGMGPYLSNGGNLAITPPVRPIGTMPFLPKYMIVVKNVELTGNFSHRDATFIQSQINASASAGWACFSISGSYSEATTEQTVNTSFNGTTISIQQPQIIGFTGKLLNRSPDPLRSLPWQGDQEFPEEMMFEKSLEDILFTEYEDYLTLTRRDKIITWSEEQEKYREAEEQQQVSEIEKDLDEMRKIFFKVHKHVKPKP